MTRELLQQALDALDKCRDWPGAYDACNNAVEALRAHLAQPQGEPVAWECKAGGLKKLTQTQYDAQPDKIKTHYTPIHPAHTEEQVRLILDAFDNIELRKPLANEVRRILGVPAP